MLSKDFKEFIKLLNENNVKYLVVGGYAVAFHGHPRYTKDLDIWIESSPKNAQRLLSALDQFGFGSLGLELEDFIAANQIIQLGYPPNRIDLLTTAGGLDFGECYKSKVSEYIHGIQIDFIDIENLKKNKRATGRSQDLADLENLR
ncbi:MAG: hypothetical protein KKI12_02425 [Proteobacteria bacterium]|nr:hypothetical protein [Pseudomonadota bacterium]MCG2757618.1 hypothetical protein [Desulfobacteraceae bacterium]